MAIAAGNEFGIVLKQNGYVWATGRNTVGQLGDGTTIGKVTLFFVKMIPGAKAVAAGGYHRMILTGNGRVLTTRP